MFTTDLAALATKSEISQAEARLKLLVAEEKADLLQWMAGVVINGGAIINAMIAVGAMVVLVKFSGH